MAPTWPWFSTVSASCWPVTTTSTRPPERGEFGGVGDEVEKDLPNAGHVAHEHFGDAWVHLAGERDALGIGLDGEEVDDFLEARAQGERLVVQFQAARLDLGEIERVVDEAQEVVAAGGDETDQLLLLGLERRVEEEARHADDAVHRRANLVTHHREKVALDLRGLEGLVAGLFLRGGGVTLGRDVVDGALVVEHFAGSVRDRVDALADPGGAAVAAVDFAGEVVDAALRVKLVEHLAPAVGLDLLGAAKLAHLVDKFLGADRSRRDAPPPGWRSCSGPAGRSGRCPRRRSRRCRGSFPPRGASG